VPVSPYRIDKRRECLDWLERLERGESVVVNLLPEVHDQRDFVTFDRPRVLRVLRRIAGDLDELSRAPDRRSVPPLNGAGGWPSHHRPQHA